MNVGCSFGKKGCGNIFTCLFFHIQAVNIPLSSKGLDKLLDELDKDGDGEVDFA